jgi:predicted MPP superfamily phosphohydrolase
MATKIAHVSDIHIERQDTNVTDRLIEALQRERPNILVASGDFADQPWHVRRGQEWLEKVRRACEIDRSNLIVIPGNHDYGIYGIAGMKPVTGRQFRKHFPGWDKPRIVLVKDPLVTFFKIDSNPWLLNFATGRIWTRQLKKLERELDAKTQAERSEIEASTKIVVVHHHPFPIPYEGKETFMMLKNAQTFILFLAERKIDMVLHGHKHRAPHSLLELGTCVGRTRVVEVVGAGTAVAKDDQDKRGNNFNIIVIEDNGLRYVRQFFAQPGEEFREVRGESFSMNAFESSYRKALACHYQYRQVHWDLQIDDEGDAKTLMSYEGLCPVGDRKLNEIELQEMILQKGHLSSVSLYDPHRKASDGVQLHTKQEGHKVKLKVTFKNSPTEGSPANFAHLSYALNNFALDASEFKKKYPGSNNDLEWAEKKVLDPMEEFSCALQLPAEPHLDSPPMFEVFPIAGTEAGGEKQPAEQQRHEWLTRELQRCFYYSDVLNTAFLSIRKPPTGYLYRISWHVPGGKRADSKEDLAGQHRLKAVVTNLLEMRMLMVSPPAAGSPESLRLSSLQPLQDALNTALAVFVESALDRVKKAEGLENVQPPVILKPDKLDINLMVYDDTDENVSPMLRIVAGSCMGKPDDLSFSLEVGDGNAGRAYKKGIVRSFDQNKAAEDPKNQMDIHRPNTPPHQMLYSIPLLDPRSPTLIFGVLNFGTFCEDDAKLLRTLDNQESLEWMSNQAQSYVLTKLLDALSIK